ncbi:MAG: hypothetical protein JSU59_05250 [Nitrospirota bacterium]|nr:MAG: hypothetical protein JSU59_05250 [Nitrospirota bacterium]
MRDLNFPGLMTVLAVGASQTPTSNTKQPRFDLTEAGINKAVDQLGLSPQEAQEAMRIVSSGQFVGDFVDATAVILHFVPNLSSSVFQQLRSFPRLSNRLMAALRRDLQGSPELVELVAGDIRDNGKIDRPVPIMTNTVRVIFREPTANQIAQTANVLLGNDSVRLAIIIYARSQGISISQEELTLVREALDPNDPDLGLLLPPAYDRLVSDFGKPQAMQLLEGMVI